MEKELTQLMVAYIKNGRSTPGENQENDPEGYGSKNWKQLEVFGEEMWGVSTKYKVQSTKYWVHSIKYLDMFSPRESMRFVWYNWNKLKGTVI